jgi:hypothetical protein
LNSKGELTVGGLGAGRFVVNVDRQMDFTARDQPRTIELDGKSEFVLDLDLRH